MSCLFWGGGCFRECLILFGQTLSKNINVYNKLCKLVLPTVTNNVAISVAKPVCFVL